MKNKKDPRVPLRVLVVDDDEISRETTCEQLTDGGYKASTCSNAPDALARLEEEVWDVVLTDWRMPCLDGLGFLREIKKHFAEEIDVILMTAYGTVEVAVEAMQEGAADFLSKPFSFSELDARLIKLIETRATCRELARLREALDCSEHFSGLVGRSHPMRQLFHQVELFAGNSASVLISGPSGTGKELVSRAIHARGARSEAPFIAVACGAIPEGLAESELLGHEKGAFTGAGRRRRGAFEMAHSGTILLDDIDDLPVETQAKLVRVLEERKLRRVGGETEVEFDVRVISTSKIDLLDAISQGKFREDLFYRIRGHEIVLPPLRERGDDILLLAHHFLRLHAREHDGSATSLSSQVVECLLRHPWAGNVRELRSAVESAATLCQGDEIHLEHLPEYIQARPRGNTVFSTHLAGVSELDFKSVTCHFENELIRWALQVAGGEQKEAARLLSLPRTTLQSKLSRAGL